MIKISKDIGHKNVKRKVLSFENFNLHKYF